ncbi:hypothetical protein [Actinoplanes sp. NBRC 103695]|uniref:hypothetical protein n=1 Tax=Actinoplanes sp. NBRC 103695 TaxID=3032202 RepID=UPI0024A2B455|nr:hypothetical protein [Actinoplanes sp. NBRC 103695]GLY99514.1 carbohydrate-binding protein [Actinoplanes sp. NBRC 103695]
MRIKRMISPVVVGLLATLVIPGTPAAAATISCYEGQGVDQKDPGLAAMPNGSVDVYKTDFNGAVTRTQIDPRTSAPIGFQNLGGFSRSEPVAASFGEGHSAVAVRGRDEALYVMQFENGVSTGWQNLGGVLTYNPDLVSIGPGHLMVFYRGTNKQLWYLEYVNGAWGPHTSLGGVLTSSPIAVSTRPDHVGVLTRGQANDLYYVERTGSTWSSWIGLGGRYEGDLVAVKRGPGIDVFVRGFDSKVYGISYNGSSWGSYYSLAAPRGGAISEPGAAVTSSGELVVFVRGSEAPAQNRPIYRNSSFDGGTTWSGWISVIGAAPTSVNNPEATANAYGGWTLADTNFPPGARFGNLRICSSTP